MNQQEALVDYLLRLADNGLILGQRLGEWCGHGPVLEQDIAVTNIALDHIGQARNFYQYAAEIIADGRDEDQLAFLRTVDQYRNLLLLEQPNEDWAYTLVRSFLYDAFNYECLYLLKSSTDQRIASIAEKAVKEVIYHRKFSSEWIIRMGDGTEESHLKIQTALDDLWLYHAEFFEMLETDLLLLESGISIDLSSIKVNWLRHIENVISEATLSVPSELAYQSGGTRGMHSEHLGYILTELQYMQRTYPNMTW